MAPKPSAGGGGRGYNEAVPAAVVPEFYKGVVGWADAARAQALGANGIASAVAVALIGTAVLGKLELQPTWVRALGLAAVICWVVAAGLFVYAVAVPADLPPAGQVKGADAFVDAVLKRVKTERDQVRRRARVAILASAVAAVLTVASLGAIVFRPPEIVRGVIVVTDAEASAARVVCPAVTSHITGQIEASSLDGEFLTIRPDTASCGDPHVLRIPRTTILAEDVQPTEDDWFPIP
ncbi:MAG: hypothetical protein QOH92_573 [Chloroflexota bacterium]|nr:hypothetical protein [Chloroflexota bacterium]